MFYKKEIIIALSQWNMKNLKWCEGEEEENADYSDGDDDDENYTQSVPHMSQKWNRSTFS